MPPGDSVIARLDCTIPSPSLFVDLQNTQKYGLYYANYWTEKLTICTLYCSWCIHLKSCSIPVPQLVTLQINDIKPFKVTNDSLHSVKLAANTHQIVN